MKVEVMIYVYLAICVGMIVFNIVNAVMSRRRDKKIIRVSRGFENRLLDELKWLEENGEVHDSHKKYMTRSLKRIGNMRAFDIALEREYTGDPELIKKYLHSIDSVFVALAIKYCRNDTIEAAYFPYIIRKYRILAGRPFDAMIDMLYYFLHSPSIYCRENAMQAIYTVGECSCVIKALKIIDSGDKFYHTKLLTDGLLKFEGNLQKLNASLWSAFEEFSTKMKVTLLNYFRFSSGDHCENVFRLMTDEAQNDEIKFSCIRYFGKYHWEAAYEYLLKAADGRNDIRWEYSAIASAALGSYASPKTIEVLKSNLHNRNWYIRFNSSQSLERMGMTYLDLIDIAEGDDRYAAEIIRYRLDIRDIIEKENEDRVIC